MGGRLGDLHVVNNNNNEREIYERVARAGLCDDEIAHDKGRGAEEENARALK